MKIMTKVNLLSLGIVLAMTVSVLAVGMLIINDILHRSGEQILRLELDSAAQAIRQKLNRAGVRAAAQEAADLQASLRQKEGLKTIELYVVESPDTRVVFHPGRSAGDKVNFEFVERMFARQHGATEYSVNAVSRFAVYTTLHPINWLVALSIDQDEMLAKKADFLRHIGAVTLLVLCLNAVVFSLFARRLLTRIRAALDCIRRIEQGQLSTRIAGVAIADEVGQLHEGINAMSARIEQRTGEQRDAERALRDSREMLQSIIDNSTAVIYLRDVDGRYLLVNRVFEQLFHLPAESVLGRTNHDLFAAAEADAWLAVDRQVLERGTAVQAEEVATVDGVLRTYLSIKYPLRDADGKIGAICGISTDITEAKKAELEHQARLAAEAASHAKSEFLATMSHELRTPLNAILGYAQLLRREPALSARQSGGLDTILQSGRHLLTLINDLLDLAKIEAGKLELDPLPLKLSVFLPAVADIIRVRVEEKSLLFVFEAPPDLPRAVLADEKRLRQVLLNLLGNAVKFTDHGQVSLALECRRESAAQVRLRFEVADTGVGMQPEQLETIFQPFEQVGDLHRRASGTGLGLSISRQLVRLMGSEIEVDSRPGEGSRFSFELSLPAIDAEVAAPPGERRTSGYRGRRRTVLVVDDVVGNRAVLSELLDGLGFAVGAAANGREALEAVRARPPDLVVTDIVMPLMDGLELIRRLRRTPGLEALPIIAASASAVHDEVATSMAAGANCFLRKPIDQDCLLQKIGELLGLDWIYPERAAAIETAAAAKDRAGVESVALPKEELDALHTLARAGNMRDIRQWAAHLAALDEQYRPFADRLEQLAQGYQSRAILALVEDRMAGVRTDDEDA